ncbi:hypothetical protein [Roseixanthobacter glucoisosaccharinicivorans]|uniref:hypothetical protein n=1 Tax=Roseixanthobacter glucoisosaccharinicivorans TaxID=3119923 RepID=UPI00372A2D10
MNMFTPHQIAAFEATQPDLYSLQEAVALGMALGQRKSLALVTALRAFAVAEPDEPITFRFSGTDGGLLVASDGRTTPVFDPVGRSITLEQVRTEQPLLMAELSAAWSQMLGAAKAVLRPLFEPARIPNRKEFEAIAHWMPLTIVVSYRLATRLIDVVQTLRDGALRVVPTAKRGGCEALTNYYSLLSTCAHLLLLASPPDGRPWFADMAKTVAWVKDSDRVALARAHALAVSRLGAVRRSVWAGGGRPLRGCADAGPPSGEHLRCVDRTRLDRLQP